MDARINKPTLKDRFITFFAVLFIVLIFVSLLPYFLTVSTYNQNSEPKPYAESKYMDIDNVKVHYQEWNSDKKTLDGKVLFIHGFYGSTFTWRQNTQILVDKGFYVVAVDIPGFGYSSKKDGLDHSLTGRANLLWEFLERLDLESGVRKELPWILIGHSMGGEIAAKMTELRQDSVADLILVAPAINKFQSNFFYQIPPVKRWAIVFAEYYFFREEQVKNFLRSAYGREPSAEEIKGYLDPLRERGTAIAAGDILSTNQNEKVDLTKIKIATQIIWGEKDTWVSRDEINLIKKDLQFSLIEIIPGAAHIPQETDSNEFNKDLLNFVAAHSTDE